MEGREVVANSEGVLNTPPVEKEVGTQSNQEGVLHGFKILARRDHMGSQDHHKTGYNPPLPMIDLPVFWGDNPRGWLRKCKKFFTRNLVLVQQRVEVASLYLEGRAYISLV
jgi:hypothetical protein